MAAGVVVGVVAGQGAGPPRGPQPAAGAAGHTEGAVLRGGGAVFFGAWVEHMTTLPGRDGPPGRVVERGESKFSGWANVARESATMVFEQRGRKGGAVAAAMAGGLVAGLMGTASGCSSETVADERAAGDSNAAAVADLRRAADVLVRSGSSRVRTTMETATGGTRVSIRGSGVYDFGQRMGRLRLVLPRDAMGAPEHAPIVELLAPGALFMRNRGAGVPAGKWVRVATAGVADGNLVTGGATDPLAAAELLRGVRTVRLVGEELLDGRVVRHYRGTTALRRAARAASAGTRAELVAAARGFAEDTVAFDAYVDGAGLLREVRHRFTLAGGEERGEGAAGGTDGEGHRASVGGKDGQEDVAVGGQDGGTKRGSGYGGGEGARSGVAGSGGAAGHGPGALDEREVASTTVLYDFGTPASVRLPAAADIYPGKVGSPRG